MSDDRLTQIEASLAFQDKTLQELNHVVFALQKQVDELALSCKTLSTKLSALQEASEQPATQDERPPHY